MNVLGHFTYQLFFFIVVVLNLLFEETDLFGILFIFLVHFLYDLFRFHLQNRNQLIELLQIFCQWLDGIL